MLTSKIRIVVLTLFTIGMTASAQAQEGVVQSASKSAAKGAIKGAQQELNKGEVVQGAKQLTKGVIDGVSNAIPLVTSQLTNQANVNRKAIGNVARQVTSDAVSGALNASTRELDEALGRHAEGPLAESMVALTEKLTAAVVRGVLSETRIDGTATEKLTAAVVRGATSQVRLHMPVWPFVAAFLVGGLSTLLCGFGLMLLYILFQRKRNVIIATAVSPNAASATK